MEPAGAVLPELPGLGEDEVAAPRCRPRHGAVGELAPELGEPLVQLGPRAERLALVRGGRTELCFARPGREVRVGLLARQALDPPLEPDLTAERPQWKRSAACGFASSSRPFRDV